MLAKLMARVDNLQELGEKKRGNSFFPSKGGKMEEKGGARHKRNRNPIK
jgi:hypothetical protein